MEVGYRSKEDQVGAKGEVETLATDCKKHLSYLTALCPTQDG